MGWRNPPIPWSELEARLSNGRARNYPPFANGNDSPAWSNKRQPYQALRQHSSSPVGGYAELHCHSNFSFLDGASHPEELAEEAARLGLSALALTDHDGLYGIVRFAEAANSVGLPTIFGTELTLNATKPQNGIPDPEGLHLVVLARDPTGYAQLSRAVSRAQRSGQKGAPRLELTELADLHNDGWVVLTGCCKGFVNDALTKEGPTAASQRLQQLAGYFGRENVFVEIWDHGDPIDTARNDQLIEVATALGVDIVATNNVHYAMPAHRRLATALAAVRARRSLDEIDGWLPAQAGAHLRGASEQMQRFARYPGAVERAHQLGQECAFDLRLVAPRLPNFPVPPNHTEMTWLRELTYRGAEDRYGPRTRCSVSNAYEQLDHELTLIEQLGFAGYFLIVWDIVEFCRRSDIFCQGRGSAANSAVCYALGITNVDSVSLKLLFERFLAPERDGPPDIDLDIESDRREEAIQYVYRRYGRDHAAQVANVITYRAKSAVRDMGKAFGHEQKQVDTWSKQVDAWGPLAVTATADDNDIPDPVMQLALEVQDFPRHLGIHSGGMVICDRPVIDVCPVEWGRMPNRSVLQWDKDDCAAVGLVKFDLLGLGMLSALHYAVDLIKENHGVDIDLAKIPQEDVVYEMLSRGDSVGVFQVESRAQMATLPRLQPKCFYDLVIEVALIRPGPIQGGSVHPYLRRRKGEEPVTYLHPLLEKSLAKTLGVPLFQEQLMQMAIDVAGFNPGEADQLRQAMGSKRSKQRMMQLRERLYAGMAERGVTGDVADEIFDKLSAFANFGFPESHSVSFAYLVYSSAWCRLHYPAAYLAALLNAQPMGFWSPQSLVADARRHGVTVNGPDINLSDAQASLESPTTVRLGIEYVRSVGKNLAKKIATNKPYRDMENFARQTEASQPAIEALAAAGAFESLGTQRREALWRAGPISHIRREQLPHLADGGNAPKLPAVTRLEEANFDLWSTGITATIPTEYFRDELAQLGVIPAADLPKCVNGQKVTVGGVVTHRQRPATAQGTVFVNLEDETGLINVICSRGVWVRYRRIARAAPALYIKGRLEKADGVINVVAETIEHLKLSVDGLKARNFR